METAITVLGIISLTLVIVAVWLGWLYISQQKHYSTEREELIKQNLADRKELEKEFALEREKWLNKLLKVNGFSPIGGSQQKPPEQKIHIIESILNRNARLKREQENKSASEVNNA